MHKIGSDAAKSNDPSQPGSDAAMQRCGEAAFSVRQQCTRHQRRSESARQQGSEAAKTIAKFPWLPDPWPPDPWALDPWAPDPWVPPDPWSLDLWSPDLCSLKPWSPDQWSPDHGL